MFTYNGYKTRWINGYEDRYAITESGIVLSYNRKNIIEMVGSRNKKRYHHVVLSKKSNKKAYSVHRLVAIAFIENPDSLPQVDHIDHNKKNNHVSNLRWITNKDNIHHYYRSIKGDNWTPVIVPTVEQREAIKELRMQKKTDRHQIKRSQMTYGSVDEMVKQTGKAIRVNGIEYESAGSAARYIVEEESKIGNRRNRATVSKELRKYLNGKRTSDTMYERYVLTYAEPA